MRGKKAQPRSIDNSVRGSREYGYKSSLHRRKKVLIGSLNDSVVVVMAERARGVDFERGKITGAGRIAAGMKLVRVYLK